MKNIFFSAKELLNHNTLNNLQSNSKNYISSKPYNHIVLDNFFNDEVANEISTCFPSFSDKIWFEYSNPIENKLASDDIRNFPPIIASAIHFLNSSEFISIVEDLTSIKKLASDPYMHGGGLHCSKKGGKLDIHLDYSIHPKLKLERRINLIIYMTKEWNNEWGGAFEMWNSDISKCEKMVYPKFNRAVIFNTDDLSFHGHPDPLLCPENVSRNSIALYYLTEQRSNISSRPRARFFKRPNDPDDKELEEFRIKRSSVLGIYDKT